MVMGDVYLGLAMRMEEQYLKNQREVKRGGISTEKEGMAVKRIK